MRSIVSFGIGAFLPTLLAAASVDSAATALENQFRDTVKPFLQSYCVDCHGGEKPKGSFDLTPYSNVNRVVADFEHWDVVLDMLESKEMPSEDAKKFPTDQLRNDVVAWIRALKSQEAARNAGDPGLVLARRLSNAEYDYTIRDLTGADIRPSKEFPVDPANQAGFDNSGESLAMSPALLKKYLEAARMVADHLILKSDGFAFASHPVVADTDRDKFSVLRIVDFYKRQPTDLADYFDAAWRYRHRAVLGTPNASLGAIASERKLSARYLDAIWATLTDGKNEAGPIARLRALWRELPVPTSQADLGAAREGAGQMRAYVTTLREKLVPEVKNLSAPGIQAGSQTLVMWKNRQMAANRRQYDPTALRVEGAIEEVPAEVAPVAMGRGGRGRNVASAAEAANAPGQPGRRGGGAAQANDPARAAAQASARALDATIQRGGTFLAPTVVTTGSSATSMAAARKRGGEPDPDLQLPADPAQRSAHEAAFARFVAVFPDAFYITERARVYRDAADEQKLAGRLLSAGLHSMTGFFRDDGPLYDLVLDDAARRELDKLWSDFEIASSIPQRMHTSFVWFERTDSRYMSDVEFDPYRPEDKSVTSQEKIAKLGEIYLAKAQRTNASETVQQAIREHFEITAANMRSVEAARVAAEPSHLKALQDFAQRAYRRPLTQRERDGFMSFYRESRDNNGLSHEEAMRDCVARVLMSPNFCYRIDALAAD